LNSENDKTKSDSKWSWMCLLKYLYRQWKHMPLVGGGPAVMPDLATMDY